MINPTTKQVQERFDQLPKITQDAIYSVETANVISSVSKSLQLSNEQISKLADEVGLVLLGFTRESELATHLTERLQISKEIGEKITIALKSEVFDNLKEELKKENVNEIETEKSTSNEVKHSPVTEKINPQQETQNTNPLPTTQQTEKETSSTIPKEKTRPYSIDPYRETLE